MTSVHTLAGPLAAFMLLGVSSACEARGIDEEPRQANLAVGEGVQEVPHAAGELEEGAQQQLRAFKTSAQATLVSVDAKLKQLETSIVEASWGGEKRGEKSVETLVEERQTLAEKVDALEVDARSKWEKTKADLEDELAELSRDVDRALDAVGGAPQPAAR